MFRHRCYFDLAGGLGVRVPPMSLPFCSRHLVSLTARRGFPWSRPVVDSFSAKEDAVIRWNSVPVGWQQIAKAILLPAVLMIYLARSAFGDVQYAITDLGTLGGTYSAAFGINNSGEVVGQAITSDGQAHAFVYNSGVPMQDLGTLGGTVSCAFGVNQGGQVVGYSSMTGDDGYVHPFLYNGSGSMQDLGTLNAMADVACAINNSGEVVGGPDAPDKSPGGYSSGPGHAFLCNGTGPLQDIGTLNGFPWSSAEGVNDSGQVVGVDPYYSSRAFLYSGGALHGTLVPSAGNLALRLRSTTPEKSLDGLRFPPPVMATPLSTRATDPCKILGALGGGGSEAFGVNNSGQIVGCSGDAFLYSGSGPMQDLNNLISPSSSWTLASATAINDKGQIAGYGTNPAGQTHAFLLTPVFTQYNQATQRGAARHLAAAATRSPPTAAPDVAGDGADERGNRTGPRLAQFSVDGEKRIRRQ